MKQRTAETWGRGDYARIAALILPVSRALVDACFISAGQEVLDVAAGNGNLTVLAGEEGASVVASDISPGQVELGRARTAAEGLDVEWVVADAEDLPFEDDRFDCVASVFGAMFGPRPDVVARELFRVVKPGGTVGMANWGPYGSQGELFAALNKYGPPLPEGMPRPPEWGIEENVQERLGPYASSLQMTRETVRFDFDSFEQAMETFGSARAERGAARADVARGAPGDGRRGLRGRPAPQQGHRRRDRAGPGVPAGRRSQARLEPPPALTSRLLIEYDGSEFAGWARQPRERTVQAVLEAALERVLGAERRLTVAGRTDTGVHALGQVASHEGDPARASALNGVLARDVRVVESERAPDGFDARRDALSRVYRYRLHTRVAASPFERGRALHWPHRLDRDLLHSCAAAIAGTHDFTAFTPTQTDARAVRAQRDCAPSGSRQATRSSSGSRPTASCATWSARWSARCCSWPAAGCPRRSSRACSRDGRARRRAIRRRRTGCT